MINNFYSDEEVQQKNLIDDFSKYVARNGIECEVMTKQKQQGNPVFGFLFGGIYSDYYYQRLEEERILIENEGYSYQHNSEFLENNATHSYSSNPTHFQHGYSHNGTEYFHDDNALSTTKDKLDQAKMSLQITQDEHFILGTNSQLRMNEEILKTNQDKILKCMSIVNLYRLEQAKKQCEESAIDFESMEKLMQAILLSCTKENICNGKNWVIENCSKANNHYPLCIYLLAKISFSTAFSERLHIVYFINDLLHHCKRKKAANLLEALESVIVPIYSLCVLLADEEGKTKMNKVLTLWETNSYTRKELLDSMRQNHVNPILYLNNWFDNEINMMKREEDDGMFSDTKLPNNENISKHFTDTNLKLENIEASDSQFKYELNFKEEGLQREIYQLEIEIERLQAESQKKNHASLHQEYNSFHGDQFSQMPPHSDVQFHMPDISRPPPGFSNFDYSQSCNIPENEISTNIPPEIEEIAPHYKPSIPYWRSPAALLVAHIRLSQYQYTPIESKNIQMPQLKPPSKRLIDISNTFYQLPCHDSPRDTEGWEKLALHGFLRAKEKAKIGEIIDDFVSSLHINHDDNENYDYEEYDYCEEDYQNYPSEEMSDFKRNFPPPETLNTEYIHLQPQTPHYGPSPRHRSNNQRSLLGTPWDDYSQKQANNLDSDSSRSFNYGGATNRQGKAPKGNTQKIIPLMSLGLSSNVAGRSKRNTFSRNSDEDSYSGKNRSRRRYSSRSRSPYDRSRSRSLSRSRSRSTAYSRSRSRSYSRSRSISRSRSRSSKSSHSSDKRPYKGNFAAIKRNGSRSASRSHSRSRSPKSRPAYDDNYTPSNLMQNLPDRRALPAVRSQLINPEVDNNQERTEDPFSRFRQNKSAGYSEWMKDRVVRRTFPEDAMGNY